MPSPRLIISEQVVTGNFFMGPAAGTTRRLPLRRTLQRLDSLRSFLARVGEGFCRLWRQKHLKLAPLKSRINPAGLITCWLNHPAGKA